MAGGKGKSLGNGGQRRFVDGGIAEVVDKHQFVAGDEICQGSDGKNLPAVLQNLVSGIRGGKEILEILEKRKAEVPEYNRVAARVLTIEREAGRLLAANPDIRRGGKPGRSGLLNEFGVTSHESSLWQRLQRLDDAQWAGLLELYSGQDEKRLSDAAALAYWRGVFEPEDLGTPPWPEGTYPTVVIDPPWPIKKIERAERANQTGLDYATMSIEDLAELPIGTVGAPDSHLYLWTTHRFLPEALNLAQKWGFSYQCLMTWVKNVGITPFSWMYSTEHVLFCRRGSLDLLQNGLRLDFQAKTTGHSSKPDVFYELVRQASPGPRIDMFARTNHEGFEMWGNEAPIGDPIMLGE